MKQQGARTIYYLKVRAAAAPDQQGVSREHAALVVQYVRYAAL